MGEWVGECAGSVQGLWVEDSEWGSWLVRREAQAVWVRGWCCPGSIGTGS